MAADETGRTGKKGRLHSSPGYRRKANLSHERRTADTRRTATVTEPIALGDDLAAAPLGC